MEQRNSGRRWIAISAGVSVILLFAFLYDGPRPVIAFSSEQVVASNETTLRILPLGDSTTKGGMVDGFNSYRPALRNLLVGSGRPVDFIGSMSNGDHVDNEHEGHGGLLIKEIYEKIVEDGILHKKPHLVLLHAGTNDMNRIFDLSPQDPYETAPKRLGLLIDKILCECPSTTLLLAQIIDNRGSHERVQAFNTAVLDIVFNRQNQGFKVRAVDHSGVSGADLGDDGVHPLVVGYDKMAQAWFEAIRNLPTEWLQTNGRSAADTGGVCHGNIDWKLYEENWLAEI